MKYIYTHIYKWRDVLWAKVIRKQASMSACLSTKTEVTVSCDKSQGLHLL